MARIILSSCYIFHRQASLRAPPCHTPAAASPDVSATVGPMLVNTWLVYQACSTAAAAGAAAKLQVPLQLISLPRRQEQLMPLRRKWRACRLQIRRLNLYTDVRGVSTGF